ncbi:unnamed protein product [Mytilus coruscus]|uniref:Uncharacterized protein n=1 Tax=Mytilus coruscus TaxID=42192 RepID=A0A6J8AKH2_MYTCO|nr:unnamed protein product [Mytilus coruscus]
MSVINVDADVKMLNDKTCEVREDSTTYDPIEFDCKFQGAGLYVFEGRSSSTVEKLSMDRLTPLSFLNIPQGTGLQMVDLAEGSCDQIKAPVNVDIWVAGQPCARRGTCYKGWTKEYSGILMEGKYDLQTSEKVEKHFNFRRFQPEASCTNGNDGRPGATTSSKMTYAEVVRLPVPVTGDQT